MKQNCSHIAKIVCLALLGLFVLLSSAIHTPSHKVHEKISLKDKSSEKKNEGKKEQTISASHGFEAVVVSIFYPDFNKEIFFQFFDFSFVPQQITFPTKRFLFLEKYFLTLFTHIISPNAP